MTDDSHIVQTIRRKKKKTNNKGILSVEYFFLHLLMGIKKTVRILDARIFIQILYKIAPVHSDTVIGQYLSL